VCRYCGRELVVKATPKPIQIKPEQTKRKLPKWVVVILVTLAGLCLLGGIISSITKPSGTAAGGLSVETIVVQTMDAAKVSTQVAAALIPTETPGQTATPVFWDSSKAYTEANPDLYKEILKNKKDMTDIQFKDYLGQQVGKRIHMIARVYEVQEDKVYLSAIDGGLFDSVYLYGLPTDFMMKLNKEQTLEFDATISNFDEFIITMMNLNDPVVYTVK